MFPNTVATEMFFVTQWLDTINRNVFKANDLNLSNHQQSISCHIVFIHNFQQFQLVWFFYREAHCLQFSPILDIIRSDVILCQKVYPKQTQQIWKVVTFFLSFLKIMFELLKCHVTSISIDIDTEGIKKRFRRQKRSERLP